MISRLPRVLFPRCQKKTLGTGLHLRAISYRANIKYYFISPIALYRNSTPVAVKKLLYNDEDKPIPPLFPNIKTIWRSVGPFYTSDLLITWLNDPLQPLPDVSIFSLNWNLGVIRLLHANHPFDMIPTFLFSPPPAHVRLPCDTGVRLVMARLTGIPFPSLVARVNQKG